MTFAPYTAVRGCGNDGPGAANMLYWLDRESPWRVVGFNLGVCACRSTGAGSTSQHARCRAWDLGLPLVNGRANPVGHQIVQALIPKAGQLGLTELIWNRKRYSAAHPYGTAYTGVSPHIDHIHGAHTLNATRLLNVPTIRFVMGDVQPPAPQPPAQPPPPPQPAPFTPPQGPDMRFFISDPSYGIRLVISDGNCVLDYGVTKLSQLRPGEAGGPMTPAQFAQFCSKYPGGRFAMGHLPS